MAVTARGFSTLLVTFALLPVSTHVGAQGQTPRPEVVKLVEAFVDTVNGPEAAADTFVKNHFTADYQKAKSAEDRRKWFQNVRTKYGKVTLAGLRRSSPETFLIVLSSEKGGEAEFEVTHDDTFKVSGLGLRESGGQ